MRWLSVELAHSAIISGLEQPQLPQLCCACGGVPDGSVEFKSGSIHRVGGRLQFSRSISLPTCQPCLAEIQRHRAVNRRLWLIWWICAVTVYSWWPAWIIRFVPLVIVKTSMIWLVSSHGPVEEIVRVFRYETQWLVATNSKEFVQELGVVNPDRVAVGLKDVVVRG